MRKHRDVFFDINLKEGATYTVESSADYYSPREKKLFRKSQFEDGEIFHLWVGRNFKGSLVLKSGKTVIGTFAPNELDAFEYGTDPKTKPEPLMVVLGTRKAASEFVCSVNDLYGLTDAQEKFKPLFDPKFAMLKNYGRDFEPLYTPQQPEIKEYVAVTEALAGELQPQVAKQLEGITAVEGAIAQIFVPPKAGQAESDLYRAMVTAVNYISNNDMLNSNVTKESAGYLQEHWRALDKIMMTVRVEKRVIGKYRVIFKGVPLSKRIAQMTGASTRAAVVHQQTSLGAKSAFIDGGYARTGRAGYGGIKRIMLTSAESFRGGLKIQGIGTIIDIVGDANTVYFTEGGSKDLSEFLARAGVSLAKAGATAALGGFLVAATTAGFLSIVGAAAVPVIGAILIAIAGYVLAAYLVDLVDSKFNIKSSAAVRVK